MNVNNRPEKISKTITEQLSCSATAQGRIVEERWDSELVLHYPALLWTTSALKPSILMRQ